MQRVYRGHAGREYNKKRHEAATTLQVRTGNQTLHPFPFSCAFTFLRQTTYRGYDARRQFDEMMENVEQQEMEHIAANMLQVLER